LRTKGKLLFPLLESFVSARYSRYRLACYQQMTSQPDAKAGPRDGVWTEHMENKVKERIVVVAVLASLLADSA
jgi:hypothetical protein